MVVPRPENIIITQPMSVRRTKNFNHPKNANAAELQSIKINQKYRMRIIIF
nr:MAG TPA: hypothetical protein [Caudoviricetes sp.]